jgi:cyclophilin family peptidyl-prolyl cis-trans isomerase
MGRITIELDETKAPETVKNFLAYADAGHYDNTIFHRVIKDFMVQGGGFDANMNQKPTRKPVANESANGLLNKRGTLAMARTSEPNSATAQFFINTVDNSFLDRANSRDGHGYCVFGKVVSGLDVVDQIRAVKTGNRGSHGDVPLEPVRILSVRRESAPA